MYIRSPGESLGIIHRKNQLEESEPGPPGPFSTGWRRPMTGTTSSLIHQIWRRRTVSALGIRDGEYVLDIATGTADMAIEAARQADCRVAGIDLSEEVRVAMKKKAQNRCQSRPLSLLQGHGTGHLSGDESFHHAMISFGVRNVQDMDSLLGIAGAETRRPLRHPGAFPSRRRPSSVKSDLFYFRSFPFIGAAVAGSSTSTCASSSWTSKAAQGARAANPEKRLPPRPLKTLHLSHPPLHVAQKPALGQ